jgi:hypothetical protein
MSRLLFLATTVGGFFWILARLASLIPTVH